LLKFDTLDERLQELEKQANERDQIHDKLAEKDRMLEMEAKQKEELQSIIKDMETKLMKGGDVFEDKEKTKAKAYREFQIKLQKQKKKEKKLKEEQLKREEELMTNYQEIQEEADDKAKIVNKLRKRYKAALTEISDLETEHQTEKSDFLEAIRTLERDLDFYKAVVNTLMKEDELYKVKAKSRYDMENNKWTVPAFTFKAETVNFPKLNINRMRDLINTEKENNKVEFKDNDDMRQTMSKAHATGGLKSLNSSSPDSYQNTGDSEDKENDLVSPTRLQFQNSVHKHHAHSTNVESDFKPESRIVTEKSHEALYYNQNTVPMKQKTLRRAEIAAKLDKSKKMASQISKLPASIRWVSTDEPDPDFFEEPNVRYERNSKALAQLVPLKGRNKFEPNELKESANLNDLPHKRKKHLPPLRE
jgi:hypothetical protein